MDKTEIGDVPMYNERTIEIHSPRGGYLGKVHVDYLTYLTYLAGKELCNALNVISGNFGNGYCGLASEVLGRPTNCPYTGSFDKIEECATRNSQLGPAFQQFVETNPREEEST